MKHCLILSLPLIVALVGGCDITGTWKTVKIEPPDAPEQAPFQMVTFAQDGQYSATHQYGNEVRTSTGTYTWSLGKLTIAPHDGDPREYAGRYNGLTKQLTLSHKVDEQTVRAILEKQELLPR